MNYVIKFILLSLLFSTAAIASPSTAIDRALNRYVSVEIDPISVFFGTESEYGGLSFQMKDEKGEYSLDEALTAASQQCKHPDANFYNYNNDVFEKMSKDEVDSYYYQLYNSKKNINAAIDAANIIVNKKKREMYPPHQALGMSETEFVLFKKYLNLGGHNSTGELVKLNITKDNGKVVITHSIGRKIQKTVSGNDFSEAIENLIPTIRWRRLQSRILTTPLAINVDEIGLLGFRLAVDEDSKTFTNLLDKSSGQKPLDRRIQTGHNYIADQRSKIFASEKERESAISASTPPNSIQGN